MRRREFVTLLASATAAGPLIGHAQQSGKIWRMGFIAHGHETHYDALFRGLRELGYEEGQNLVVVWRYAASHPERFPDFAAEMVRLNVDVIIGLRHPPPSP